MLDIAGPDQDRLVPPSTKFAKNRQMSSISLSVSLSSLSPEGPKHLYTVDSGVSILVCASIPPISRPGFFVFLPARRFSAAEEHGAHSEADHALGSLHHGGGSLLGLHAVESLGQLWPPSSMQSLSRMWSPDRQVNNPMTK